MPTSSNFQAIREAQSDALVGPVVNSALRRRRHGALNRGDWWLSMMATPLFMPLFWVAVIGNLVLFFVAQNVAEGNNTHSLALLSVYSLIAGFTLVVCLAAGRCGCWCSRHRRTGHRISRGRLDLCPVACAIPLARPSRWWVGSIGLILAMVVQFIGGIFAAASMAASFGWRSPDSAPFFVGGLRRLLHDALLPG